MKKWTAPVWLALLSLVSCETRMLYTVQDNPYAELYSIELVENITLTFTLVKPEIYDPEKAYPVLIAFPPGVQDAQEADWALEKYWITSSIQRNWIVLSVEAPEGIRFFEGSERLIPALFDWVRARYAVEGDKFHAAGLSAGGWSAFRVGIEYPGLVQSIIGFPGVPPDQNDFDRLDRISHIPVAMFVGSADQEWLFSSMETEARLKELGADVKLYVIAGAGHVIGGLSSRILFDLLDGYRPGS